VIAALVLGVAGTLVAQGIHKADPSWAYIKARPGGIMVSMTKAGAPLAQIYIPSGNVIAVSDGRPIRNRTDFEGTFELRALPESETRPGPAADMMSTAPLLLRVENVQAVVENRP